MSTGITRNYLLVQLRNIKEGGDLRKCTEKMKRAAMFALEADWKDPETRRLSHQDHAILLDLVQHAYRVLSGRADGWTEWSDD